MRNFLKTLFGFTCALCCVLGLAACGFTGGVEGGSGGGDDDGKTSGGGSISQVFVEYDEQTGLVTIENADKAHKIVALIDGREYTVTNGIFSVSSLDLRAGEYTVTVIVYLDEEETMDSQFRFTVEGDTEEAVTVDFMDEFGNLIKRIYFTKGETLQAEDYPALPVQEGVVYAWNRQPGAAVVEELEICLTASYTEYTVTYQTNGGELPAEEYPTVYTVRESVSLPEPTRQGYLFAGWYESSDFSGKEITSLGGRGKVGNKTLYAKWSQITAEAQELIAALETTLTQKTVTVSYDGYEEALDASSGYYAHLKADGDAKWVVTGGYRYDYADKSRYAYSRTLAAGDIVPLEGIYGNMSDIRFEKSSGGEKSFLVRLKGDNEHQLRIKIKDGKISFMGDTSGQTEISVTYSVSKLSPKASDFVEKTQIFILPIYDGQSGEEIAVFVAPGQQLSSVEELNGWFKDDTLIKKGFFLNSDGTEPVTKTDEVQSEVYFVYCSLEYARRNTPVTLRHTCECGECNGKTTDYQISYNDVEELWRTEFEGVDEHLKKILTANFHEIGDGYSLAGPFVTSESSDGKYEGNFFESSMIEMEVSRALEEGREYENLVIELYTERTAMETFKVAVQIEGETVKKYYPVSAGTYISDDFVYDYIPEGRVYCGWYADEALKERVDSYTDAARYEILYAKLAADTRKTITVHLGTTGFIEIQDRYHAQGQADLRLENTEFEVKFFDDTELLQVLHHCSWGRMGSNTEDMRVAGFYTDAAFQTPVTDTTKVSEVTDIYLKWGEAVEMTLHYINGNSENYQTTAGTPFSVVVNFKQIHQACNEQYRSVAKFYSDAARTQEIASAQAGDIYVGYEEFPTVTLICEDGCDAGEHTFKLTGSYIDSGYFYEGGVFGVHGFNLPTGEFLDFAFYLDEEKTQSLDALMNGGSFFVETGLKLYGFNKTELREFKVHCGCLTHGNAGVQLSVYTGEELNRAVSASCNFGRPLIVKNFYKDAAREDWFYFDPWSEEEMPDELWLMSLTPVTVVADGEEKPMLVTGVYDVVYFYEEEPTYEEGDGEMKEEVATDPSASEYWALFEDAACTTPRILSSEYKPTENEKFYFKKISYPEGQFKLTIDGGEYGVKEIHQSFSELRNSSLSVDPALFADNGKKAVAYYYDAELTELAMELNKQYYFNQSITLYAKLIEMPKMTVHYLHNGYEEIVEYDLYTEMDFRGYMWREVNFEYLYEEGYTFDLCKNADGTGLIDIEDPAAPGEYYFCKNVYSVNNIKLTLAGIKDPEAYRSIYLPKGATGQEILRTLSMCGAEIELTNGQTFCIREMIMHDSDKMQAGAEEWFKTDEMLTLYTDAGKTKPLTDGSVYTEDVTLYFEISVSRLKAHTVYLGDQGSFIFYTTGDDEFGNGMNDPRQLIEYLSQPSYIDEMMYSAYPDLFRYGAISVVYVDEEHTKQFDRYNGIPDKLYATLTELYAFTVKHPTENRNLVSYVGFIPSTVNEACYGDLLANARNYGFDKAGYLPYLASDEAGNNEVSTDEVLENGTYYICYRRDESKAKIAVAGCSCGQVHEGDFWLQNKDENGDMGAEGGNWYPEENIGTYQEFYLPKGESLQILVEKFQEFHHYYIENEMVLPPVELYLDAEYTQRLNDLTVTEDITVYVKVSNLLQD